MDLDGQSDSDDTPRPSWPARLLIGVVLVYQATLRPFMGGQCKYMPTCSEYMISALRVRGALVGFALGVWRILRCNPFSGGGYDPVPPRRRP